MQKNRLLTIATLLLVFIVQVCYAQDLTPRWKIVKPVEDIRGTLLPPTSDGNFYKSDGYSLIKYNFNGDTLWSKRKTNIVYTATGYVKTKNDQFCIASGIWEDQFKIDTFIVDIPKQDILVSIYRTDSSGNVLWLKYFKGQSYNTGNLLTTDTDGNFYFFGQFNDSITIDGVTIKGKSSANSWFTNLYLAKFSGSGDLIWLKNMGNANKKITASSIITDKNNNMYIAGTYGTDTLTILPYTLIEPVKKDEDVFLAKIDTAGNTQWVRHFPDEVVYLTDWAPKLKVDNDGNVLMYWTENKYNGMGQGYILKYHPNGEIIKKIRLYKPSSSVSNYRIAALEVDSQNNIYMAAEFSEVLTPIPAAPKIILSVSRRDVVFLKYDSAFNLKWYKHIINKWENYCFGFTIFNNKEIYLFGEGYGYIVNQVPQNISFGGEYEFYFSNSKSKLSYLARIETCNPIEENLVKNNAVLEAPQAWGNWQWYVDSTKIEGATWYSYAPKKSGTYTVLSKDGNSCYRLSKPYVWIMTGTDENLVENNVNIYPNPTLNKQFTLQTPDKVNSITIYSIEGSLYKNIAINPEGNYEIEINQSGVYFVRIDTPQGLIVKKIIVQ